MAELQPNDELLVNRDNVTYTQEQGTIMANLQGDDYLLINRDDATYKITGQEFIDSVVDPLELTVVLDDTTPAPSDTINAIASPAGGKQPYTAITYQWKQRSEDGLVTDIASATRSSLSITPEMASFEIACEATVGDSLGSSVTTLSDYTDAVAYQEEVDTPELITPPDGAGLGAGISPESGVITDVTIEGANATMYGLRFDADRQTLLQSAPFNNIETHTLSVWFKPTEVPAADNQAIIAKSGGASTVAIMARIEGSTVRVFAGNLSTAITYPVVANQWYHLVFNYDSATSIVTAWLNGADKKTSSTTYTNGYEYPFLLGRENQAASGSQYQYNGYTSDVYFVDGQALEPTAFGYALEDGTWAPLDSADVTTNIGDSVQAPVAPNYDQKWSDLLSVKGADPTLAFDGNLATRGRGIEAANNGEITWQLDTTFENVTSLRIRMVMRNSETIIVNGTESYFENQGNDAVWVDFPSSDLPSTVTSIAVAADVATTPSIYAIEVNGRLLIDGPADNSQVWSEFVDTQDFTIEPNRGPDKGFDGDLTTSCAVNAMGSRYSIYLKDLSFANEEVRVYTSNGSNSTSRFFKLNGATTGLAANLPAQWITLGNAAADGTATIEVGSTDEFQRTIFYAIEIGGKLLIDGCARWNTSQTWSDNSTGNWSSAPVSQGFDGNLVTEAAPEDGISNELVVSFDEITAKKIEVYRPFAFFSDVDASYVVEGADGTQTYTIPGEQPEGWTTVYEGSEIRIDTIKAIRNSAGTGGEYRAWRFDGELLVDGGSFGANGFHLPFDPAATGEIWSTSITSPLAGAFPAANAFDGNTTTYAESTGGVDMVVENNSFADGSYFVEVYSSGTSTSLTCKDSALTFSGSNNLWTGTVTNPFPLVIQHSANPDLYLMKVNGVTLVDHNNIGVDDSGNGNHFHDSNFAVGNTDEVWSDYLSGNIANSTGPSTGKNGFNGSYYYGSTPTRATDDADALVFDVPASIQGKQMYVYARSQIGGTPGYLFKKNDGSWLEVIDYSLGEFPSSSNITNVFLLDLGTDTTKLSFKTTSSLTGGFGAIVVDGEYLVDKNIQDTVKDTPMRNAAVLESGTNGNLVASAAGTNVTYTGEPGRDYYYEANAVGVIHSGGDAISSTDGVTYNFGQQPFAASNVTHDIDAGTAEIDGETYGTLYQPLGSTTATLTIADAGTLGLIEGTPTMTAKAGGATGTYASHTDTELVLSNTSGAWSVASETAISDTEHTIAAIDPNDFVMTSSEFSATPLEATHGSSTWQVTEVADTTYANPVIDVTSESALTTYNAGGLKGDTTYRARVKHTSSNDVDSLWSEEVHQNIFKTEPALLDTPDATMYGLRFDDTRETVLTSTIKSDIDSYTVSVWVKYTNTGVNKIIEIGDAGANYFEIRTQNNKIISYSVVNSAQASLTLTSAAEANRWYHVVVSRTATEFKGYLDGGSPVVSTANTYKLKNTETVTLGQNSAGTKAYQSNGYRSDYYFVDGHALEPTEFGALFPQDPSAADRRWGPLDSSVVTANINNNGGSFGENGFHLPFDPSQTGQAWSNDLKAYLSDDTEVSFQSAKPATFAFDGKTSDGLVSTANHAAIDSTVAQVNTKIVWTPSTTVTVSTDVKVYGWGAGSARDITVVTTNGTFTGNFPVVSETTSVTIPCTGDIISVTSVSPVAPSSQQHTIGGIEVDGKLLTDHSAIGTDASGQGNHFTDENFAAGNTDEVWNQSLVSTGTNMSGGINAALKAFDGNLNTAAAGQTITPGDGNTGAYFELQKTFTNVTSLEVQIKGAGYNNKGNYTISGAGITSKTGIVNGQPGFTTLVPLDLTSTTISNIKIECVVEDASPLLAAIKINGEFLIDANIQDTVTDTPMRNYAVLDPSLNGWWVSSKSSGNITNGNLNFEGIDQSGFSTLNVNTGNKYYSEVLIRNYGNSSFPSQVVISASDRSSFEVSYSAVGDILINGVVTSNWGDSWTTGDLIGVAVDAQANTVSFFKNGAFQGTVSNSFNSEDIRIGYYAEAGGTDSTVCNFGQQPFAGSNVTYDQETGIATLASAAPNTSQVWSDNLAAFPSFGPTPPSQAFDGNLSTLAASSNNSDSSLTFTYTFTDVTKLRVYQDQGTGYEYSVNGGPNQTAASLGATGNASWVDLTSLLPANKTLNSIKTTTGGISNGCNWAAIEVNGRILVDNDPTINNSQVWSRGTASNLAMRPLSNLFDGSTDTSIQGPGSGSPATYTFAEEVPFTKLRLYLSTNRTGATQPVNGKDITFTETIEFPSIWHDITDQMTAAGETTLKSVGVKQSSGYSGFIAAIEIDDKILVDAQGFTGGTYNTLYQTWDQYATYGLFFYNENTDEIIQKFTLQRRYGLTGAKPSAGIYELAVQPNFAVAAYIKEDETYVPIENPEPRIAAAEAQAAAEVAAAQAETRKYQRMLIRAACGWVVAKSYAAGDIIIYNGHVFRALEDNVATADNDPGDLDGTWEFLGLEEDAAPLAIDGYFPLYETEEASNAAGNGSSHTHIIDGVTYYMPDSGVTIYHGNYTGFDY